MHSIIYHVHDEINSAVWDKGWREFQGPADAKVWRQRTVVWRGLSDLFNLQLETLNAER